jgi:hypothetical protein
MARQYSYVRAFSATVKAIPLIWLFHSGRKLCAAYPRRSAS